MLAITGSKHGNFYIFIIFFVNFSIKFLLWFGLELASGLGLVVFPRSRLCLFHQNDNRLLLEMIWTVTNASTVYERKNCVPDW